MVDNRDLVLLINFLNRIEKCAFAKYRKLLFKFLYNSIENEKLSKIIAEYSDEKVLFKIKTFGSNAEGYHDLGEPNFQTGKVEVLYQWYSAELYIPTLLGPFGVFDTRSFSLTTNVLGLPSRLAKIRCGSLVKDMDVRDKKTAKKIADLWMSRRYELLSF